TAASLLLAGILLFRAPSPVIERGSEPVSQSAPPALRSGTPSQQETCADERLDTAKAAPQAYSQAMEQTVNTRRKAEATQESARMAPPETRSLRPLAAMPVPKPSAPSPAGAPPSVSDAQPSADSLETAKPRRLEKELVEQKELAEGKELEE